MTFVNQKKKKSKHSIFKIVAFRGKSEKATLNTNFTHTHSTYDGKLTHRSYPELIMNVVITDADHNDRCSFTTIW